MSTELAKATQAARVGQNTERRYVQPRWQSVPAQDGHELRVWMPGVGKSGVEVSLVEDQLTIVGRRGYSIPENWRPVQRELDQDDYRLRLRLNQKVDQECISAHVEDGVLTLSLPIPEEAKPRTIPIE